MKKYLHIILFVLVIGKEADSQVDPHFSQFYANPLWLNPGMAGVIDGGMRISAIYRNQWNQVMVPFTTRGFSMDFQTNENLNIGASILNQQAGNAGYNYNTGGITIAYSGMRFGTEKEQQVVIGIQAGFISRHFDPAKFQFGDQWNPVTGFDPATPSADQLSKTRASSLDLGAGLSYMDGSKNKTVRLFGGFSAFHLTKPEDPFISAGTKTYLPVRFSVHGGARISLTDNFSLIPNLLWMKQGSAQEKMAGVYGDYTVNEQTGVMFGLNYRFQDAISPFAGLAFGPIVLGVSYDINNSSLGKAVPGTNSLEVSLSWISRKSGKPLRYLSCPRF